MTMVATPGTDDVLAKLQDGETQRVDVSAVAVLNRSEVEAQIEAAHRYPRSVHTFMREAIGLATLTREVAESCIYTLPRDGKEISGPSVRLAEIAASAYGNLHVAARVVDEEERFVVAQGIAWDCQRNLRVCIEVKRRITTKQGKRFGDDMIGVTGNAAASIGLRNAIFRVIPRAYIDTIYAEVRRVAVGDAKTLATRRVEVIERLAKIGVLRERVLAKLGKASVEDVMLEDVEVLIGLGMAIKSGERTIDDAFPAPSANGSVATQSPEAAELEAKLRGEAPKDEQAPRRTRQRAPAAKPDPEPPFGNEAQATVVNAPIRNWEREGKVLWDEIQAATTPEQAYDLGPRLMAWEKDGAPAVLVNPIRTELAARRARLETPS